MLFTQILSLKPPIMATSLKWPENSVQKSVIIVDRLCYTRGGTEQSFISREVRPNVQPLTLLYTIFDRKGTPFTALKLGGRTVARGD